MIGPGPAQRIFNATFAGINSAAFDGQNGQYRYMGNHGPCNWKSPVISTAGAVETMKNKIREGKVPGVTDPAEAPG